MVCIFLKYQPKIESHIEIHKNPLGNFQSDAKSGRHNYVNQMSPYMNLKPDVGV
jgi:hypothetical protein